MPLIVAFCFLLASACIQAQTQDRIGSIEFSVRMVGSAELPVDTSREWLNFLEPGIASGALGAVAPPMYASGLIVGGLLLVPGSVVMSNIEHKKWKRVADTLNGFDFEKNLLRAVRARVARELLPQTGHKARAELIIEAYGIVGKRPERTCFITIAHLVVAVLDKEIIRDRLVIADASRSSDAPPAQCSTLDRFAERNGELVLDTATEYIEVLAVMATDRIKAATTQ